MSFEIAIIGMESLGGQEILTKLHERDFPVSKIHVACEDKNQVKPISFGDKTLTMVHVDTLTLTDMDLVFLTGTAHVASQIIEKLASSSTKIIDLTKTEGKILSVPDLEVFPSKETKLVAAPCSSTIQLCQALKPLDTLGVLENVTVSTYHSVSEIGRPAMDELFNQVRSIYMNHEPKSQHFSKQIAFNVLPQVGDFEDNHSTSEEEAMTKETLALLEFPLQLAVHCTYVPTFIGHAQAVTVQFKQDIDIKDVKTVWRDCDIIEIIDLDSEMEYVTPSEIHGEQQLFLSRIRKNPAMKNALSFWSVTDNIQNGVAYNAVRIAEHLLGVEPQT